MGKLDSSQKAVSSIEKHGLIMVQYWVKNMKKNLIALLELNVIDKLLMLIVFKKLGWGILKDSNLTSKLVLTSCYTCKVG